MNRSHEVPVIDEPHNADAGGSPLTDPPTMRLGARRRAVLHCLHDANEALGVAQIAALTRLHPNTVRFHLDALTVATLVTRTVETRTSRGRPRVLYTARAETTGPRSFGLLAQMLADLAGAAGDLHDNAVATGHAWGQKLVAKPSFDAAVPEDSARRTSLLDQPDHVIGTLHQVFDDLGFQPERSAYEATTTLQLHNCPFREVALRHPTVVCGLHLGMTQGMLAGLGGAVEAESLDPFVSPRLCVARLHATSVR